VLLHLVDATAPDPLQDCATLVQELAAYGHGLVDKPRILALSKADALDPDELTDIRTMLQEELGQAVLPLSAVSGLGVTEACRALLDEIDAARGADVARRAEEAPWTP
jgi:GTP-binding protein